MRIKCGLFRRIVQAIHGRHNAMKARNDQLCRREFLTRAAQATVAVAASAGMGRRWRHGSPVPARPALPAPPESRTTATARFMSTRSAGPRENP